MKNSLRIEAISRISRRLTFACCLFVLLIVSAAPGSAWADAGTLEIKPGPMINGDEPMLSDEATPMIGGDPLLEGYTALLCMKDGKLQLVCEGSLELCLLVLSEQVNPKDCLLV